ncbi:MAG: serine protease [Solirubrobacteraceae bacterium]|nr:serine protease [Solirubrobacteraceae bacterium]
MSLVKPHRLLLLAPAALVLAFGVAGCGDSTDDAKQTTGTTSAAARAADVPDLASGTHEQAVSVGLPSVVAVSVSTGGETRNGTGTLLASGLVATDAALVTTAAGAPAAGVTVREGNGEEHAGVVDGIDALSGLAAVRVRDLSAVPVAKTAKEPAVLGQPVVALGFLSSRRPAMRPGTVLTTGRAARGEGLAEVGLFEASAPLGAQGLGGPLVNLQGQVVGISTRRLEAMSPGAAVGLPVASAVRIVKALGEAGRVRRAYLGIETVGLSPTRVKELDLTTSTGVLLRAIAPGSPAAFSTLRPPTGTTSIGGRSIPTGGDVIVQLDGKQITEPEDIDAALATMQPGKRVTMKVIRGQESVDVKATLNER